VLLAGVQIEGGHDAAAAELGEVKNDVADSQPAAIKPLVGDHLDQFANLPRLLLVAVDGDFSVGMRCGF
jgi:hypothetical protein